MKDRARAALYVGGLTLASVASWGRAFAEGSLRIDTGRPSFFLASAVLGVGLALATWAARGFAESPAGRKSGLDTRTIAWTATLAATVASVAAPLTSSDLFHYLLTGRLQLLGKNPFAAPMIEAAPDPLLELASPRWIHGTSSYGPVANLASAIAAWIGEAVGAPLAGNAIAWKLMMAACVIGFAWIARAHLERRGDPDRRSILALAVLSPLLPWEIAGQGHNEGLLVLALLLFTVAATEGRATWAAVGIAVALQVKVSVAPIFVLYFVFLVGQRRSGAVVPALVALASLVLTALPYLHGFHGFGSTFEAIRGAPRSHSFGDFLYNVLAPLGPSAQDVAVRASFWLAIAACAPVFAHALTSRTVPDLLRRSMLFFLVWDLVIPTFEPWYLAWLAPFVVVERDARWRRLVWVYASWSAILWIAPIDPFSTMALDVYIGVRLVRLLRSPT